MTEGTPPPPRRRPVLAISGWLLFVCLFLPTLRVCGDPTAPIQFPPAYGVYLGALAIGIAAVSRTLRARRIVQAIVVGLVVASVLTFAVLFVASALDSDAVILFSIILGVGVTGYTVVAAARAAWTPRGIAIGWVVHASIASAWNTLLVLDPDHMWGARLALVAAGAMLVDAMLALATAHAEVVRRRQERTLPVARMIDRSA